MCCMRACVGVTSVIGAPVFLLVSVTVPVVLQLSYCLLGTRGGEGETLAVIMAKILILMWNMN